MNWLDRISRKSAGRRASKTQARPAMEGLETRLVLYSASSNAWPAAQLVTISFMPDGTNIGGRPSDMQARFNSMFGSASAWQSVILKAAQTWATYANINFEVVADNGAAQGSGSNQQGDPNFGDIRIGGYNFFNSTLATAYMPPPVNNFSIAGDVQFNTGQTFKNGTAYDLFTVAAHEIGHSLGLYHSNTTAAVEYGTYNGTKSVFNSDDIAGIRSIYGVRPTDAFDAIASNNSAGSATDVTSLISPSSLTAVLTGLDITTTSDVDYYKFTVPAGTSGTFHAVVSSDQISLLSPLVSLTAADGSVIASAGGAPGTAVSVGTTVVAGETYYLTVDGVDSTVMGTGRYGVALNFGVNPTPDVPQTVTLMPNGSPISAGGGLAIMVGTETRANTTTANKQGFSDDARQTVAIAADGRFVIVWTGEKQDLDQSDGIYGQAFAADGSRIGSEFRINTTTFGGQVAPSISMAADGQFIVAWTGQKQDPDQSDGIYARRFDAAFRPAGDEYRVNTTTSGSQAYAVTTMAADGAAVVAWMGGDGSDSGIFGQRFGPDGTRAGGEFRINSSISGNQSIPTLASTSNGGFVAAWLNQPGIAMTSNGIFARRFNPDGTPAGDDVRISESLLGSVQHVDVGMDDAGNYVVAWTDDRLFAEILARRVSSDGDLLGETFQVNSFTMGDQRMPSIAMSGTGGFLISWTSSGQDYSGLGIYGQQYDAAGTKIGAEIKMASSSFGDQTDSSTAINGRGQLVVAWTGRGSGDMDGVYFQRFDTSGQSLIVDGTGSRSPLMQVRLQLLDLQKQLRTARKDGDIPALKEIRRQVAELRAEANAARRLATRQTSQAAARFQGHSHAVALLNTEGGGANSTTRQRNVARILARLDRQG